MRDILKNFLRLAVFGGCFFSVASRAAISKELAEATINETIDLYRQEINEVHGVPVEILYRWESQLFQATAGREERAVQFAFSGGLLGGQMTKDKLRVLVCHELGHVLGGLPEVSSFPMNSVEGQADYFATAKCLKRVFAADPADLNLDPVRESAVSESVYQSFESACGSVYSGSIDHGICVRSLSNSLLLFAIMYKSDVLTFEHPDPAVAEETLLTYPATQCRLDTLKAGALCVRPASERFSYDDLEVGACRREIADEVMGARPRCWFAD